MKTIRIGKSRENDCVLTSTDVSRTHAILELTDPQHGTLRDLNSKNGTYVNGKRITECKVTASDTLRFASETTNIASIIARANKTVIIQGHGLPSGANCRTIGRDANNQIQMRYDDVSQNHAILYQMSDGSVFIEDRNSTNGTFVNGIKVTSQKLNSGDKVTITRNHTLNWESYFQTKKPSPKQSILKAMAAAAVAAIVIVGAFVIWPHIFKWDKERIYEKYSSAVCWVYVQYGYKIYVDDEDITPLVCKLSKIPIGELVHLDGDNLVSGPTGGEGTGFFIRNDGVIATNLHVVKDWLFTDDKKKLSKHANKIIIYFAGQNPFLLRSQVKVDAVLEAMYIIPNGLPISEGNLVKCTELKSQDDIHKDVALIQTESRGLPQSVKKIIDINDVELSEDALKEGKTVYTIGFPHGSGLAMNSNKELRNQVHGGSITQNRGDYEFGHDAETANGASGSPILNDKGRLIGIHHAGLTGIGGGQGFNMGIKAKYIVELLKK